MKWRKILTVLFRLLLCYLVGLATMTVAVLFVGWYGELNDPRFYDVMIKSNLIMSFLFIPSMYSAFWWPWRKQSNDH